MVLRIIFATIIYSYTMLAISTTEQNKTSTNPKAARPAILNMSGFVVVDVGQEAVLECRLQNLAEQFTVWRFIILKLPVNFLYSVNSFTQYPHP